MYTHIHTLMYTHTHMYTLTHTHKHTYACLWTKEWGSTANIVAIRSSVLCLLPPIWIRPSCVPQMNTRPPCFGRKEKTLASQHIIEHQREAQQVTIGMGECMLNANEVEELLD